MIEQTDSIASCVFIISIEIPTSNLFGSYLTLWLSVMWVRKRVKRKNIEGQKINPRLAIGIMYPHILNVQKLFAQSFAG